MRPLGKLAQRLPSNSDSSCVVGAHYPLREFKLYGAPSGQSKRGVVVGLIWSPTGVS